MQVAGTSIEKIERISFAYVAGSSLEKVTHICTVLSVFFDGIRLCGAPIKVGEDVGGVKRWAPWCTPILGTPIRAHFYILTNLTLLCFSDGFRQF